MPANDASPELRLSAGSPPPLDGYDADIIILSLDRLEETIEAIKSALQQRGGTIHVTVLDQGSSPEMLRELRHQFSRHPHFSLYESGRNLGVPGGRTAAAGYGHGQFIVALDNDAVFETPWVVAKALRLFRQTPDLAAIGFNILAADGKQPDMTSWGYPKAMLPRYRDSFDTTTFVGAGHAIRRSAWTAAGGYDPSLFFTWEEYDFCLAAIARGWRILYEGGLAVIHTPAAEARVRWQGARMTHFIRNRLVIARKWRQSWLLAPWLLGYGLIAARHGIFSAAWAGFCQGRAVPVVGPRKMPGAMRDYIRAHETRQRGTLLTRVKLELLSRLPV